MALKIFISLTEFPLYCCYGLNQASSPAPTQPIAQFPLPTRTEDRIGRSKARKVMCQDKDSLLGEGKGKKPKKPNPSDA